MPAQRTVAPQARHRTNVINAISITFAGVAVVCALGLAEPSPPPAQGLSPAQIVSFGGEKCLTRPSRDSTMGFAAPTRITEVLVKGGEEVKKGQLLIRGDDAEDTIVVNLQKIRADTDLPFQKAVKTAELAKVEFERTQLAFDKAAASKQDLDRARLTWEGSDIDAKQAKQQQEQEEMQVTRLVERVNKLQIRAPYDGQVDVVMMDVGQSVSETDKIIRVVNVDPIWMDVPTPTARLNELNVKLGDPAWVLMDLPGEATVLLGKVIEVSPVADSSSATRRVRVEVANKQRRVPGVQAWVRFTEPTGDWKARIVASMPADQFVLPPRDFNVPIQIRRVAAAASDQSGSDAK